MSTGLRVTEATRARAAGIAAETGTSIGEVVERALDAYETAEFWRRTRDALAAGTRDDVDAGWDRTVRDGLDLGHKLGHE